MQSVIHVIIATAAETERLKVNIALTPIRFIALTVSEFDAMKMMPPQMRQKLARSSLTGYAGREEVGGDTNIML